MTLPESHSPKLQRSHSAMSPQNSLAHKDLEMVHSVLNVWESVKEEGKGIGPGCSFPSLLSWPF
jgi:hypothetical protein